jgi:predicted transposase YbfD/YdcC
MHLTTLPFDFVLPDEPLLLDLQNLYDQLQLLPDQRQRRGVRYPLAALLLIAVLAKLTGHSRVRALADWASLRAHDLCTLFQLPRTSMPHHTTWSRVLGQAVDPSALDQVVTQVLHDARTAGMPARGSVAVALDGKTLRGTIPLGQTRGVHLLAAYLPSEGVVLAQVQVDRYENEIVAAPTILRQLDLQGMVVTGDAMFTQRALSTQIVEAGGDYLWQVKDNQPELHQDIALLFTPDVAPPGHGVLPTDFTTARSVEKGHGRREERVITVSSMLHEYSDWPYLAQVFKLERTVMNGRGRHSQEVRYGVTSLPATVADAERLLDVVRQHWGIENGLHYRRDVTLAEDASLVRTGQAPQVLATLNNAVLGLFARHGAHNVAAAQRALAYRLDKALARLNL